MKLRASEFISKAEGLKSSELSIRQKLEGIRSRRSSIQSEISTLEFRLDSLYMQLEALESSDSDDEDGADNSGAIAAVMAEISSTQDDISDCRQQDAELRSQEMEADAELRQIEMEEQETLSDIQDSAARTNQNIALISSFGGDYANVSAQASGSFQHNLGQLSQAAQILGGNVAMGVAGAGGRSAGRLARGNAGQTDGSGRNFYEAANNQRKSGSSSPGAMGSRGNGGSAGIRTAPDLYSTHDDIDDRTPKKGGIGNRIANAFSGLMGKRSGSDSADFSGFIANKVSENKWHITGDGYPAYKQFYDNMGEYHSSTYSDGNRVETINPNLIEGISVSSREIENPDLFWSQHQAGGTKDSFVEIAKKIPLVQAKLNSGVSLNELFDDPELGTCASIYFDVNSPSAVRVLKGDGFYEFESNGRHRVLAARALGYAIPVVVVGTIESNKSGGMGSRSNAFRERIRVNPDTLSQTSPTSTRPINHGPRDPLERELDAELPSSNAKKFGGMGAKEQPPNSANGVRNQLLNTEITRKMEKVHDFKLRTQAHDYLKREQYSKEKWETLSVDQKKASLTAMVGDLNRLLGTNISGNIEFYHDATRRSRGQYVHGEKKVRINECYLIGDTSWRIYQTVIHEMRHAYQHYAVENPDKVNVSKETIAKWKENFENYKSPKNGCSFEEYISQPIEWDAKNFANQVAELVGSNPEYPGSWSESELEVEP